MQRAKSPPAKIASQDAPALQFPRCHGFRQRLSRGQLQRRPGAHPAGEKIERQRNQQPRPCPAERTVNQHLPTFPIGGKERLDQPRTHGSCRDAAMIPAWIKNARIADSARPLRIPTNTDDEIEITPNPSSTAASAQPSSPSTIPMPTSTQATQKKMSAKRAMPKSCLGSRTIPMANTPRCVHGPERRRHHATGSPWPSRPSPSAIGPTWSRRTAAHSRPLRPRWRTRHQPPYERMLLGEIARGTVGRQAPLPPLPYTRPPYGLVIFTR